MRFKLQNTSPIAGTRRTCTSVVMDNPKLTFETTSGRFLTGFWGSYHRLDSLSAPWYRCEGKKKDPEVLDRILGVLKGIPDSERGRTPIHVFGVSGELTPVLAYMGIDSFDSTSYIQTARGLNYSHPETRRKQKIMELDETSCTCHICRKVPLDEMHRALSEEARYRRTSTGKYKSEYYAAIALHNFEMEVKLALSDEGSH